MGATVPLRYHAAMFREALTSMSKTFARGRALALVLAGSLAACGGGSEFEQVGPGPTVNAVAPEWFAPDVNPASPLFNTLVTPRQRLGMISAWYFAHAT
jgi:hypothetical protein